MPTFALGRNRPLAPSPKLRLGNYMLRKFPASPIAVDYAPTPSPFLKNILGNADNGCCTIAAAYHINASILANASEPLPPDFDTANVLKLYYQLTGGPDTGLDEQLVFNWWRAHGLLPDGSHKITTKVLVDATDPGEIQAALWLFENLYIVAELPDAWIDPFPSADGFTWGVAGDPDPDNGHAFCAFAYGQGAVRKVDSWGLMGNIPYPALAEYGTQKAGGGVYAVLSPDIICKATAKAPNGFDWSQLNADINSFQL